MNKKIIYGAIIVLIIVFGFLFYNSLLNKQFGSIQQSEKVIKIGVSVTEPTNDAPLIVAQKKGFFSEHGLKVEMVLLGSGGGDIKQALATGNIDIGATATVNFLIAASKGAPVKILAFKSLAPLYLFVNPESNIKTFNDLNGKIIGARPDGSSALLLKFICEKENVDFNSLKFFTIEKTFGPIALMEKKIVDAVPVSPGGEKVFEEAGAVMHKEWEEKGYTKISSSGATVFSIIAVNTDFMSDNPEIIEPFIDAYIEGHRFIKDNPDEAAILLAQYAKEVSGGAITPLKEDIKKQWEDGNLKYLLWRDSDILVELSKIAKEAGLTERVLTLEEMFDMRFEEKLKSAQNEIYGSND